MSVSHCCVFSGTGAGSDTQFARLQTQLDATAAALAAKEAALYAGQHRQQLAALRAHLEALQGTTDEASPTATTVQAVASDNAMRGSTCKSLRSAVAGCAAL